MILFSQIPEKLQYPAKIKAQLMSYHSDIISYVSKNFKKTTRNCQKILGLMNTITYHMIEEDVLPSGWKSQYPFENIQILDDNVLESKLKDLYLYIKDIKWDIPETYADESESSKDTIEIQTYNKPYSDLHSSSEPTNKEDLYIRPPLVPQFDYSKVWLHKKCYNDDLTIYTSLPEIPTKQNEISITTDVDKMLDSDLMKLYPNRFIPTRSGCMYSKLDGVKFLPNLGLILPIQGYSEEDLIDNVVKYPHLFRLLKYTDDKITSFYSTIEIDGHLYDTLDVWDDLPESTVIPRDSDFIKEYVVRRYLLERDISHIDHKYKMYGTLDPFLTLFTTPEEYSVLGYSDAIELARQCVRSRISYKYSRNPIIRRIENE